MADRLLTAIPPSGKYPERRFDTSTHANTWVLFEPPAEAPWVGIFGNPGIAHYSDLVPFPHDSNLVLVVAGAQGYIVDRTSGSLLRRTRRDYCYAALPVPGSDRILLADSTRIWCASPARNIDARADSPLLEDDDLGRIGLDGIILGELGPDRLHGAFHRWDGWFGFTMDLDSMLVRRGPRLAAGEQSPAADAGRGYPPTPSAVDRALSFRLPA
jgi:hypothetical protein